MAAHCNSGNKSMAVSSEGETAPEGENKSVKKDD